MTVSSDVRVAIDRVEAGEFDDVLCRLEGEDLGIWIPAHALDGSVVPIPPGYLQEEAGSDLGVVLVKEAPKDTVAVGWSAKGVSAACGSDCIPPGTCHSCVCTYCPDIHQDEVELPGETELDPFAMDARVKAMFEDGVLPLDRLEAAGLSVFMVHGHAAGVPFTTLPNGYMAVIEEGRTRFRLREDVLNRSESDFVPTTWRFEDGERRPVGGFAGRAEYDQRKDSPARVDSRRDVLHFDAWTKTGALMQDPGGAYVYRRAK